MTDSTSTYKITNPYFCMKDGNSKLRLFVTGISSFLDWKDRTVVAVKCVVIPHEYVSLTKLVAPDDIKGLKGYSFQGKNGVISGEITFTEEGFDEFFDVEGNEYRSFAELVESMNPPVEVSPRVMGFFEAKRKAVEAIDFRLDNLKAALEILNKENFNDHFGYEARIDELTSLRSYVKGMVVKADDHE